MWGGMRVLLPVADRGRKESRTGAGADYEDLCRCIVARFKVVGRARCVKIVGPSAFVVVQNTEVPRVPTPASELAGDPVRLRMTTRKSRPFGFDAVHEDGAPGSRGGPKYWGPSPSAQDDNSNKLPLRWMRCARRADLYFPPLLPQGWGTPELGCVVARTFLDGLRTII